MYSGSDSNNWSWLAILALGCGFVLIVFIYKKFLNNYLYKYSWKYFPRSSEAGVCSSLSCVRCSTSVFSTEKLLEKWRNLQESLKVDVKLRHNITRAILRESCTNKISLTAQSPTVFYLEDLPAKVWYTAQDYARDVTLLEAEISSITSEFENISQKLDIGWVSNIVPSGGWYLFYLVNQGIRIEANCQRCPKTMAVIEKLPLVLSDCVFGNVMFSMLLPGTEISEHCGPTNTRIRCHLPIRTPEGYFIKIAGEERTWQEGEVLVFDDLFYHEVYHHGNSVDPRVVLMLDFWHPALSFQQKEIIKTLFAPQ